MIRSISISKHLIKRTDEDCRPPKWHLSRSVIQINRRFQGMPNQQRKSIPPILGLSLGIFASSTASIFIRYAQQDAPSLVIAAYRLVLATVILLPILLLRDRASLARLRGKTLQLAVLAGFFLALHFASWISSLEYTSVASSVVFVSTSPLYVALLSQFFLGEQINPTLRYAIALALLGTLLIALSDACSLEGRFQCPPLQTFFAGSAIKGDLLALGGGLTGAGYILIGRKVQREITLLPYINLVYGIGAIFLVGFVGVSNLQAFGFPPITFLWLLLLALIPQLIGHSMINWALRFFTAAFVSITLLVEPIGSSALAFIILDERPRLLMVFGSALILSGVIAASLRQRKDAP